jgi:hypothetical protein
MERASLAEEIRRLNASRSVDGPAAADATTLAALALGSLSASSNVIELLARYDTRFDRQFKSCLVTFVW